MVIEALKEKTFIPTWNGNSELPESEQIRVVHRFAKPDERKRYIYTKDIRISGDGEMRDLEYVQDQAGLVKLLVTKIENIEVRIGDTSVAIDTVEKLYGTAGVPQMLVSEIERYMLTASPEVDSDFLA